MEPLPGMARTERYSCEWCSDMTVVDMWKPVWSVLFALVAFAQVAKQALPDLCRKIVPSAHIYMMIPLAT